MDQWTLCLAVLLSFYVSKAVTQGRNTWIAYDSYEYLVSSSGVSKSYNDAQTFCGVAGDELALVKTQEIHVFIKTLVTAGSGGPYAFYFGLQDPEGDGTYVWNDNESITYQSWHGGEPNNFATEKCAAMGEMYTYVPALPWYNYACTIGGSGPKGFVCQRHIGKFWGEWGSWGNCECPGWQTRNRTCLDTGRPGPDPCNGTKSTETTVCYTVATCPGNVTLPTTPPATTPAPSRGIWSINGSYEYFVSSSGVSISHNDAQSYCVSSDSELALVKTQQIQEFIASLVSVGSGDPYAFFIGLQDSDGDGKYVWDDSSALAWDKWAPGEPNNYGSERCAAMGKRYTYDASLLWHNYNCTVGSVGPAGFVCQRQIGKYWGEWGSWGSCECPGWKSRNRTCLDTGRPGPDLCNGADYFAESTSCTPAVACPTSTVPPTTTDAEEENTTAFATTVDATTQSTSPYEATTRTQTHATSVTTPTVDEETTTGTTVEVTSVGPSTSTETTYTSTSTPTTVETTTQGTSSHEATTRTQTHTMSVTTPTVGGETTIGTPVEVIYVGPSTSTETTYTSTSTPTTVETTTQGTSLHEATTRTQTHTTSVTTPGGGEETTTRTTVEVTSVGPSTSTTHTSTPAPTVLPTISLTIVAGETTTESTTTHTTLESTTHSTETSTTLQTTATTGGEDTTAAATGVITTRAIVVSLPAEKTMNLTSTTTSTIAETTNIKATTLPATTHTSSLTSTFNATSTTASANGTEGALTVEEGVITAKVTVTTDADHLASARIIAVNSSTVIRTEQTAMVTSATSTMLNSAATETVTNETVVTTPKVISSTIATDKSATGIPEASTVCAFCENADTSATSLLTSASATTESTDATSYTLTANDTKSVTIINTTTQTATVSTITMSQSQQNNSHPGPTISDKDIATNTKQTPFPSTSTYPSSTSSPAPVSPAASTTIITPVVAASVAVVVLTVTVAAFFVIRARKQRNLTITHDTYDNHEAIRFEDFVPAEESEPGYATVSEDGQYYNQPVVKRASPHSPDKAQAVYATADRARQKYETQLNESGYAAVDIGPSDKSESDDFGSEEENDMYATINKPRTTVDNLNERPNTTSTFTSRGSSSADASSSSPDPSVDEPPTNDDSDEVPHQTAVGEHHVKVGEDLYAVVKRK